MATVTKKGFAHITSRPSKDKVIESVNLHRIEKKRTRNIQTKIILVGIVSIVTIRMILKH